MRACAQQKVTVLEVEGRIRMRVGACACGVLCARVHLSMCMHVRRCLPVAASDGPPRGVPGLDPGVPV
jgi:hypothetical protein